MRRNKHTTTPLLPHIGPGFSSYRFLFLDEKMHARMTWHLGRRRRMRVYLSEGMNLESWEKPGSQSLDLDEIISHGVKNKNKKLVD